VIFWVQTGLSAVSLLGAYFVLPETIYHKKIDDLEGFSQKQKGQVLWSMVNPIRVILLLRYPNILLVGIASSALIWNMYSLLAPIRYVLNPRFELTTPMQGGLFYLAPGCGYLAGTFGGGRYADYMVKKWIKKRDGVRIPEDRLRSSLPAFGIVIPACMLVYGWSVEKAVGGIPVVVITLFLQGVAQLFCFPSVNTYCMDVMQSRAAETSASNYLTRYVFACAGISVVLPAVEAIGVGWFSTISAGFVAFGALSILATVRWGKQWRDAIDMKEKAARQKARDKANRAREQKRMKKEAAQDRQRTTAGGLNSQTLDDTRDLEKA
jgi:MFS family permease